MRGACKQRGKGNRPRTGSLRTRGASTGRHYRPRTVPGAAPRPVGSGHTAAGGARRIRTPRRRGIADDIGLMSHGHADGRDERGAWGARAFSRDRWHRAAAPGSSSGGQGRPGRRAGPRRTGGVPIRGYVPEVRALPAATCTSQPPRTIVYVRPHGSASASRSDGPRVDHVVALDDVECVLGGDAHAGVVRDDAQPFAHGQSGSTGTL